MNETAIIAYLIDLICGTLIGQIGYILQKKALMEDEKPKTPE